MVQRRFSIDSRFNTADEEEMEIAGYFHLVPACLSFLLDHSFNRPHLKARHVLQITCNSITSAKCGMDGQQVAWSLGPQQANYTYFRAQLEPWLFHCDDTRRVPVTTLLSWATSTVDRAVSRELDSIFARFWRFLIASVISSIQRDMQSAEAGSSCGVLSAYVLPEFRRRASRWNWFDSMVMQLFELARRCWKRMARPDLLNWRIKRWCESGW